MKRIGRYEVLGVLGQGGMGTVLRARDPELGREVAVKLLESGSSRQRDRFRREAEGLARLQHPNVVRVHEVGQDGDRAYIVMELIEGEDLQDAIDRDGPMPAVEVAEIGRDLARVLEQAHGLGILHRDLKPGNVMSSAGRCLLTDFGLARLDDAARLTQSGAALGTPGFWPPEQALGKRDLIGPASDIYGLGATLYALASGRAPFERDTIQSLLVATCEEPPTSLQPQVDAALDGILLRCLAKAPQDRYPSAGALADDLERYLAGELTARRGSVLLAFKGLAAVAVVILVVTGIASQMGRDTPLADATGASTPSPLPPGLERVLTALSPSAGPAEVEAAEAAVLGLDAPFGEAVRDAVRARAGVHGPRLVILRRYRDGDLVGALAEARAATDRRDPWAGRAWRALTAVQEARTASGGVLRILADMGRSEAPGPPADGLKASWVGLSRSLVVRENLSPKLGRLRALIRDELRANAVAAHYLLGGPAKDHQGEREAFVRYEQLMKQQAREAPELYDRLDALETRLQDGTWQPQPGDVDLVAMAKRLEQIPGTGAEVLRIGCLCLIARDLSKPDDLRIGSARAAATLAGTDVDRPLGLNVRLGRAWRRVTNAIVAKVYGALRQRRPAPYDLSALAAEFGLLKMRGQQAMALYCLGRWDAAEALAEAKQPSVVDLAIILEGHLIRGRPQAALDVIEAQAPRSRQSFRVHQHHAQEMLDQQPIPLGTVRGVATWFPWRSKEAVAKIISGEWWWPGERYRLEAKGRQPQLRAAPNED